MGIKATLSRLNAALKVHDRELWYHLEVKNQVNPQFYAFRWITLLLTQVRPGVRQLAPSVAPGPSPC